MLFLFIIRRLNPRARAIVGAVLSVVGLVLLGLAATVAPWLVIHGIITTALGIAFCIARTLIARDPSLKAPMRANLRKMWELLEEREDHGAADMVDTMIKALNDPAFFKP